MQTCVFRKLSVMLLYIFEKKFFFVFRSLSNHMVELFFVCVFTKSIILLRLAKCEIIITNSVLCASLVINISYLGAQIEELLNIL